MPVKKTKLLAASFLTAFSAATLHGCNTTPRISPAYGSSSQNINSMSRFELPSAETFSHHDFVAKTPIIWWTVFEDPVLNMLVDNSIRRSFDVRRAVSDVERAEAIVRGTRAGNGITTSLMGELGTSSPDIFGSTKNSNGLELGLSSSWNLDLFGAVRHNVKATEANVGARKALQRDVQRLVIARTVQAYIAYRSAQERSELAAINVERLTLNAQRIERLMDGGYNTKLDLRRSENQIYELQATLAALRINETSALNALAALTNSRPKLLKRHLASHRLALAIPHKIPTPDIEVITRHRPDIREAQWKLMAATHGVDAARAGLYPNITLSANTFFSEQNANSWPQLGSLSGSLITGLAAPLLGRGRLLASVDQRQVDVRRALIDYEESVLQAILDVDNGMNRWQRNKERLAYREAGLNSAVEAQQLAERLFYAGESDFTASVLAERSRLQAEDNYLLAKNEALNAYINYVAAVVPVW